MGFTKATLHSMTFVKCLILLYLFTLDFGPFYKVEMSRSIISADLWTFCMIRACCILPHVRIYMLPLFGAAGSKPDIFTHDFSANLLAPF